MKKSAKSISGERHSNKDVRVSEKDERSARDILGELKDIVKVASIKDVHAFIDENDSISKTGNLKQVKSLKKMCQKPDHNEHEKKIAQLSLKSAIFCIFYSLNIDWEQSSMILYKQNIQPFQSI